VYLRDDGVLKASVERAARDLRRIGQNTDLIDEEVLADALSEGRVHEQLIGDSWSAAAGVAPAASHPVRRRCRAERGAPPSARWSFAGVQFRVHRACPCVSVTLHPASFATLLFPAIPCSLR
jgi:hypothetical protein